MLKQGLEIRITLVAFPVQRWRGFMLLKTTRRKRIQHHTYPVLVNNLGRTKQVAYAVYSSFLDTKEI